jgi:hypothetical protein
LPPAAEPLPTPIALLRQRLRATLDPGGVFALGARWV